MGRKLREGKRKIEGEERKLRERSEIFKKRRIEGRNLRKT
jgi:hypothetical protein